MMTGSIASSSSSAADGQSSPSKSRSQNGTLNKSAPTTQLVIRPTTWRVFLMHFVLPMTILIFMSNGNDMYKYFTSIVNNNNPTFDGSTKQANLQPTSLPTSSTTAAASKYKHEVDAAIERKQRSSQKKHQSSSKTIESISKRPTGPQSTPLYQQMEAKIKKLHALYEESRGTPTEYLTAIQYADFLKYRDATIHDGGTHQIEAIEVYTHAINLLEDIWRYKLAKGEDVRLSTASLNDDEGGYQGLNQELFLDYADKSIEGIICAALSSLGKVYFMANMFDRAVDAYEQCLSYDHEYLDSLAYRAQSNVILGKYDEAGRDYKRVIEKDNDRVFVDAVTGLAKVLTAKEDSISEGWDYMLRFLEVELPRLEEIHERIKQSNSQAGMKHYSDGLKRLHHAFFAYHDIKSKNTSEAWKHLAKGNEYKLATVEPFNASQEKQRVQMVKQVFVPNFFMQGIGSQTRTPIFIIGFVRSGSTLLERILDAHPLIVGTGEDSVFNGRLDTIRNEIVKASIAGDTAVLYKKVKELADDVVSDMKSRWEVINVNMHEEDDEEEEVSKKDYPTRFADKMLTNYMNVGFIHLLFPNALILHVAREPMDTIFSAFKHDFPPGGLDYTSEFAGLAQLYDSYRDVMEHWDTVLPGRVTHIRYEDMVTDLPNIAPKIIDAAGVPWDPTVLEFHKKKHAVNTLSTTQVRKGVYSHHFKGWKRYEEFLQPLHDRVGKRVEYDLKTTLSGYTPPKS